MRRLSALVVLALLGGCQLISRHKPIEATTIAEESKFWSTTLDLHYKAVRLDPSAFGAGFNVLLNGQSIGGILPGQNKERLSTTTLVVAFLPQNGDKINRADRLTVLAYCGPGLFSRTIVNPFKGAVLTEDQSPQTLDLSAPIFLFRSSTQKDSLPNAKFDRFLSFTVRPRS